VTSWQSTPSPRGVVVARMDRGEYLPGRERWALCMANKDYTKIFKTVLQFVGISCLVGIVSMVFHKAFIDISALAQRYSGVDFWAALARQILRNLAGGG